jgi:hypothetical protein
MHHAVMHHTLKIGFHIQISFIHIIAVYLTQMELRFVKKNVILVMECQGKLVADFTEYCNINNSGDQEIQSF